MIERGRSAFTLVELLTVIVIVGLIASLTLPAVMQARETARRMQCGSHLRQVGFGLLHYHDSFGYLPPSVADRTGGSPKLHTWMVMILPFVEQRALFDAYDFNAAFNSIANRPVVGKRIELYTCPSAAGDSMEGKDFGPSNFAANSGSEPGQNDGVLFPISDIRLSDILDGTNSTLLAGELYHHNLGWARGSAAGLGGGGGGGADAGFARGVSRWWRCASPCAIAGINPPHTACSNRCEQRFQFSSRHFGGAQFVFCDGHISFLNDQMDSLALKSLFTRDANEFFGEDP